MLQTAVRSPGPQPASTSASGSPGTSRSARGRRWAAGSRGELVHALALTILLPVAGILLGALLSPYLPAPESHPYDGSPGAFVIQGVRIVFGAGLFVGVCLLLVGRLRWRDLGWRDLSWRQVALGLGGFVATTAVFCSFLVAATELTPAALLEAVAGLTWRQRLLGVVIGVNASIVEESLFRGYLQPALCKRLGTAGGIVTTAVLFSLMHVPGNVVAFGGRLILGLGMGLLRGHDRPLWAPAILHTLLWAVIGMSL